MKNVTHRDLKLDNIFIKEIVTDKEDKSMVTFKLGDFGFAFKSDKTRLIAGNYPDMSPEMYKLGEYGNEADVWTLGVMTN
jgi:serine/threonine protein kinase